MTDQVATFKRIMPHSNCGLSDTQINKLIDDWRKGHQNLSGHEFGYQLALYMTTYKRDNQADNQKNYSSFEWLYG